MGGVHPLPEPMRFPEELSRTLTQRLRSSGAPRRSLLGNTLHTVFLLVTAFAKGSRGERGTGSGVWGVGSRCAVPRPVGRCAFRRHVVSLLWTGHSAQRTLQGGVGVSPSRVVQRAPVPCAAPLGSLQTERGAAMDAAQSGGRRLRSRADPWGACAPDARSAPETATRGHGASPAEAPAHERRAAFDVHLSGGAVSKRNISRRARGEGRARPDLDATAGLVTAGRPPAGNLRPPLSSGGADVTCDGDAVTQKMWPLHVRSRREGRASPDTAGERVNIYISFLEGIWQRVQSLKVMLAAQL